MQFGTHQRIQTEIGNGTAGVYSRSGKPQNFTHLLGQWCHQEVLSFHGFQGQKAFSEVFDPIEDFLQQAFR